MKTKTKVFLGFVTGAGIGATAATLYLRNFYTKFINETLNDEVNRELDKIKKDYDEALAELKEKLGTEQTEEEAPKQEQKKSKEQKKEESTDYTKYSEEKKKKGSKTVKDVRTAAMEQIQEDKTNEEGSYIIASVDYTEDNGYEKVTATYYPQEQIYTNDYDQPDADLPYIIGSLVNKMDDYGEGNYLYVRNDQRETDYEIIFSETAYGE